MPPFFLLTHPHLSGSAPVPAFFYLSVGRQVSWLEWCSSAPQPGPLFLSSSTSPGSCPSARWHAGHSGLGAGPTVWWGRQALLQTAFSWYFHTHPRANFCFTVYFAYFQCSIVLCFAVLPFWNLRILSLEVLVFGGITEDITNLREVGTAGALNM